MSTEVRFHPQRASKEALEALLREYGYRPCGHLWNWPKGSLHFHLFENRDFLSYDGVEATIFPPSAEEIEELGPCEWALQTRTRSSASPYDKHQQDEIIREARKRYGGSFYNDWQGKNRYNNPDPDQRDAVARGIYLVYERVTNQLTMVNCSLPDGGMGLKKEPENDDQKRIIETMLLNDPVRALYNAVIPFIVSCIEHFFQSSFKIMLQYNAGTSDKLIKSNKKIDVADVLLIECGKKTINDVVADWYSFQSIDAIHKAYSDWLGIDVWKILRKKKRIGNNILLLENKLRALIDIRHGIIHRFDFDPHLDKASVSSLFLLTRAVIEEFVAYLEKTRGVRIRD